MNEMRPVVDFDHHSQDYKNNWQSILADYRQRCPVAWTEHHGGYWVVSRYEDVVRVFRDTETFATTHIEPNDGKSYTGVQIPSWPDISLPMEVEGHRHARYRRLLNPWFAPGELAKLTPRISKFAGWCIDQHVASGKIDFVNDVGNPVPAMVTLEFLGFDLKEWEFFAPPLHGLIAFEPGTPDFAKSVEGYMAIIAKIEAEVAERRASPRNDRLTEIAEFTDDDGPLDTQEILSIIGTLLAGGVDTSTILIAHALDYLDRDRDARRRLIEEPSLLPSACEEFLRHASPGQIQARTATKDTEIAGQRIAAGERVLMSIASANRDPAEFADADEVVLDRFPNHHVAFGVGAHRCIGAALAREEFIAILGQVLQRVPDYRLLPGAERYPQFGISQGWVNMPAVFTPCEPLNSVPPWM